MAPDGCESQPWNTRSVCPSDAPGALVTPAPHPNPEKQPNNLKRTLSVLASISGHSQVECLLGSCTRCFLPWFVCHTPAQLRLAFKSLQACCGCIEQRP